MTAFVHICTASSMHPYNCNGPGKCIHCDEVPSESHAPKTCALCMDGRGELPVDFDEVAFVASMDLKS